MTSNLTQLAAAATFPSQAGHSHNRRERVKCITFNKPRRGSAALSEQHFESSHRIQVLSGTSAVLGK